jgi:hypothetical protein
MHGTVSMTMGMFMSMIVRVSVVMIVSMLMRGTIFMLMVVPMFVLYLRMRVTMIMVVRRTIGMHMKMPAVTMAVFIVLHGLAVYGRFSRAATAYVTHHYSPYSTSSSLTRISFPPVTCNW